MGGRSDDFDQYLKRQVEDPAVPALKRLAIGATDNADRSAIAMFIALTAARCPGVMKSISLEHVHRLPDSDRAEFDELVQQWCSVNHKPVDASSQYEFLKPDMFGAMWFWCRSLQHRLMQWDW